MIRILAVLFHKRLDGKVMAPDMGFLFGDISQVQHLRLGSGLEHSAARFAHFQNTGHGTAPTFTTNWLPRSTF
jgi:hypothetical protein